MADERRRAERMLLPEGVGATVADVSVELINLSAIGALFEHVGRFAIPGAKLEIVWRGMRATLPFRIVRTAIMGRRESEMIYQTGVQFVNADPFSEGLVTAILRIADPQPPAPLEPAAAPATIGDDTWTRRVNTPPIPGEGDDTWTRRVTTNALNSDDGEPFIRFCLTPHGWTKEHVTSSVQPEDGFTVARDSNDFAALQRTFENSDEETRRRLRRAIEARLHS